MFTTSLKELHDPNPGIFVNYQMITTVFPRRTLTIEPLIRMAMLLLLQILVEILGDSMTIITLCYGASLSLLI